MSAPGADPTHFVDPTRGACTYAQAAALLGIGRTSTFELVRAGKIRRVRIPGIGRPRLLRSDVEALVAAGVEHA